MEKIVKGISESDNHQQLSNQQREIKTNKTEIELEARLKEQEFREMLKRLKKV